MNYRIIRGNWQLFYGSLYGVLWYRINSHTNVLWNKLHTKASFVRSCLDRYWSARPNRPAWPGNDPNQTSMFIDALSPLPGLSPYKAPKPQMSEGRIGSNIGILNKSKNISILHCEYIQRKVSNNLPKAIATMVVAGGTHLLLRVILMGFQ